MEKNEGFVIKRRGLIEMIRLDGEEKVENGYEMYRRGRKRGKDRREEIKEMLNEREELLKMMKELKEGEKSKGL